MYALYKIYGERGFYDLSNGSLSDDPIGEYHLGSMIIPIYSAELMLNAIESEGTVTIYKRELPEENIVWKDDLIYHSGKKEVKQ